jgi:hypothetical protein
MPDMALALFEITPSVTLRQTYNDNIFFSEEDPIDDSATVLSPELELRNRSEILDARLSGRWDEWDYHKYHDLDSSDQRVDADVRYRPFTTTSFSAAGAYIKDSRRDRDIEETGLLILTNEERQRVQARMGGDWAWSEVDSVGFTLAYAQSEYDDPEFSDSVTRGGTLTWARDISRLYRATSARLTLRYDRYDFEDYWVENIGATVGLVSSATETWSFSLDAGARYVKTEYEESTIELVETPEPALEIVTRTKTVDDWGGTGIATVNYRGETSDTRLSLSHDIREASGRGGVVNRTSLMFNTVHRLSETFRIILFSEYFLNKAEAGKESVEDIDEETFNLRPSLRWTVFTHMDIDLSYAYTWVQDDIDASEVSRNVVSISLTLRQPLLNP